MSPTPGMPQGMELPAPRTTSSFGLVSSISVGPIGVAFRACGRAAHRARGADDGSLHLSFTARVIPTSRRAASSAATRNAAEQVIGNVVEIAPEVGTGAAWLRLDRVAKGPVMSTLDVCGPPWTVRAPEAGNPGRELLPDVPLNRRRCDLSSEFASDLNRASFEWLLLP